MRKPKSSMEMTFIGGKDRNALKAGVGCIAETDAETWALFRNAKRAEVPQRRATFLLDYYNRRGDLADTIFLDNAGFQVITGEKVKTEAQYKKIDRDFWRKAQAERQKQAA